MPGGLRSIRGLSLFAAACLFVCAAPAFARASDPKIDALADKLAHRLGNAKAVKQRQGAPVFYLVFDISDSAGHTTLLGGQLADTVSEALSNRLPGLTPIDRAKLRELRTVERIESSVLRENVYAASWAAKSLGARLVVLGTIEPLGEKFNLHLRVIDQHSSIDIADAGEYLDWTEERRLWDRSLLPSLPPVAHKTDLPSPGRGYPEPVCMHCAQPQYTDEARKAGIQGTILVEVTIGPEGRVEDVVPIRGLPCGLTQETVAVAKTWQFQPVIGPDGKAVRLRLTFETTFGITSFR